MKIGVIGFGERALIAEGTQTLVFKGCESKMVADNFSATEGAKVEKYLWQFANAQSEQYSVWTNTRYGSDRAGLTQLLDLMLPGITKEDVAKLDTDDLVGRKYRARIVHRKNANTGKVYAQHTILEPIEEDGAGRQVASASTVVPVAALPDPFADEE